MIIVIFEKKFKKFFPNQDHSMVEVFGNPI